MLDSVLQLGRLQSALFLIATCPSDQISAPLAGCQPKGGTLREERALAKVVLGQALERNGQCSRDHVQGYMMASAEAVCEVKVV